MKIILYFFLVLFMNCNSQMSFQPENSQRATVKFEDRYHYPFTLTNEKFLVVNDQAKMDRIFGIIYSKNKSKRMAPIPTVLGHETYLVFKPVLKNSNDVLIEKMSYEKNVLYVSVREFNNPDFPPKSRIQPNILVKLSKRYPINKVVINY